MKNKKVLFFCCCLGMGDLKTEKCALESFIVPPTAHKKESKNALKESCAEYLMANLKEDTQIIKNTAQRDEFLLEQGNVLLEGTKSSFFAQASPAELQEYRDNLHELQHISQHYREDSSRITNNLKNLTCRYSSQKNY